MLLIPVIDPGFVSKAAVGSEMQTPSISHQTCQRRNPPLCWTVEYYHDLHQALLLNICWHCCSGSRPLTCCTSTLWASWLADELPRQVCVCVCCSSIRPEFQVGWAPCGEYLSLQGMLGEYFSDAERYDGNVCDRCTAGCESRPEGLDTTAAGMHCVTVITPRLSLPHWTHSLSQEMQTTCYHSYFHVECREGVWGDLLCSLSRHIWMLVTCSSIPTAQTEACARLQSYNSHFFTH